MSEVVEIILKYGQNDHKSRLGVEFDLKVKARSLAGCPDTRSGSSQIFDLARSWEIQVDF